MSTRCRKSTPGRERPPISHRAREYAYWTVCVAAAVVLVFGFGLRMTWWQGTALWCSVVAGRMAARHNERRHATDAATARRQAMLSKAAIEQAAREAFWADDTGGHIAGHWTWDTIPEVGRENYRKSARAVITAALREDHQ